MKTSSILAGVIVFVIVILLALFLHNRISDTSQESSADLARVSQDPDAEFAFSDIGLQTNTNKLLIPFDEILGGGPPKDGIPSLSGDEVNFVSAGQALSIPEDSLGVLIATEDETRFYPYTILVWHEIVNDTIDGVDIAVTFCPLCGSAVTYSSEVNGKKTEFGVSGKLWQSNLLMYDIETESLWSQIEGKAVVGDRIGEELEMYPMQLVTFSEAKASDPELQVLSEDTGYAREYGFYPYGDYEDREELIFPVNNLNTTLPAKTLMYASVISGEAVAFRREVLLEEKKAVLETKKNEIITATVDENNLITLTDQSGKTYPGYVTMWFSWANHNEGEVWMGE